MNQSIYERNIPGGPLQPYLEDRPVLTRYSILPVVDPRKPASNVPLKQVPTYNVHQTFNPGTSAPWSGYANFVNRESELKGIVFALQKCDQAVYVPSSTSSLYNSSVPPPPATKTTKLITTIPKINPDTRLFFNSSRD